MDPVTISILGGGNMGRCLIGGLIANAHPAERIRVGERDPGRREALQRLYGVSVEADNRRAAQGAEVLVLALKPQVMSEAVRELAASLDPARPPLVISIAAGIPSDALARWLGTAVPVIRAMPNTPALVQAGATALYARPGVSERQRELAEGILRSAGLTLWLEEERLMDVATAVSGSGPAYFFLLMEHVQRAAEALGLSADQARQLTVETAFGAAKMALESGLEPAQLRAQVSSPGGTTERALALFEQGGMEALVRRALNGACERAGELAREYGER